MNKLEGLFNEFKRIEFNLRSARGFVQNSEYKPSSREFDNFRDQMKEIETSIKYLSSEVWEYYFGNEDFI